MSFRLVPNSVTLDDLKRRNRANGPVISTNSVAFGADYVKVVIGGFRDTYLGRQVVSRPGVGMGSAGVWRVL